MKDDVRNALMVKDIDYLCEKYSLLPFQASVLSYGYNKSDRDNYKEYVINKIISGKCAEEKDQETMAKNYCSQLLLLANSNTFDFLCNICGFTLEHAKRFVETFIREKRAEKEMLDMEVDSSNINIRINQMLDDIVSIFIASQKQKKL